MLWFIQVLDKVTGPPKQQSRPFSGDVGVPVLQTLGLCLGNEGFGILKTLYLYHSN